jgi:hypothetical protein
MSAPIEPQGDQGRTRSDAVDGLDAKERELEELRAFRKRVASLMDGVSRGELSREYVVWTISNQLHDPSWWSPGGGGYVVDSEQTELR